MSLQFILSEKAAFWGLRDCICYETIVEDIVWNPSPTPSKELTRIPLRLQDPKKLSCFWDPSNLVDIVSLITGGFPFLL